MPALELSPDEFRGLAARVSDAAADYLAGLDTRPAFPPTSGARTAALFGGNAPEEGLGEAAFDALSAIAAHARAGNGRFFAYVMGSGEPVAALGDLYASVLNQNVTAWRSSPSAVTLERTVVGWLAEAVGCGGFTGSLTGGGSSANLMGLAMAREKTMPANESGARPGIVYASAEAHMSIPKAMALLGVGRANLRLVPVDDEYRMRPDALAAAIAEDVRHGREAFAIVASAGSISTGSIDPLVEIAAIARAHGLWLHVDGAYGGFAALAVPEKFAGLDLADSISLDAHKWLYQPIDCGVLLYRDSRIARETFAYTGDYAKSLTEDPIEGYAFFEESIELTRRFRALKLWLSIRYHGLGGFRTAIAEDLRHARLLADLIDGEQALERVAPVELSAVCFRWTGGAPRSGSDTAQDERNARVLRRVIERGHVVISNATLHGRFVLRACVVNHRSTDEDVAAVVSEVLAAATEVD